MASSFGTVHVAVRQAVVVGLGQCGSRLGADAGLFLGRQWAPAQFGAQGVPIHQFTHEVALALFDADVEHGDQVGVMDRGQRAGLVQEASGAGVVQPGGEQGDADWTPVALIGGVEDLDPCLGAPWLLQPIPPGQDPLARRGYPFGEPVGRPQYLGAFQVPAVVVATGLVRPAVSPRPVVTHCGTAPPWVQAGHRS